jgi:hypothetical protein
LYSPRDGVIFARCNLSACQRDLVTTRHESLRALDDEWQSVPLNETLFNAPDVPAAMKLF